MSKQIVPFDIDEALDCVDLSFKNYEITDASLEFMNIIRLVMGDFEIPSPKFHYFLVSMLLGEVTADQFPYDKELNDTINTDPSQIGIISSRGSAKSTVSTLFYPIYAAVKGTTPVTGKLSHILILSDSAKGGAKDQALLMGNVLEQSKFAQQWFEKIRFTETEVELIRRDQGDKKTPVADRHMLIKFKGAQSGGIRSGSRNMVTKDRYAIIIADDVIKNEKEAYSDVIMHNVNTAIASDAGNAFRSRNNQLILVNTPFHKNDPIYKLVESGGVMPLVTPICKEIRDDLTEEEFEGLWPSMHDYESVMKRYRNAKATNNLRSFNQELMLRISDEESRMVSDDMIEDMWFSRGTLAKSLDGYNLYITTDLTASEDNGSGKGQDYSGVFLWAYSHNKDWFLIDMVLAKQGISAQYDAIFRLISNWGGKYGRTVEVGIEVDGQQRLNIPALRQLQRDKNIYFNFARQKGDAYGKEGINSRRFGSKMDRFRNVYPLLQNKKIFFAEELRDTPDMKELLRELRYLSLSNMASSHDDGLDCMSQITLIEVIEPSPIYDTYDTYSGRSIYNSYSTDDEVELNSEIF